MILIKCKKGEFKIRRNKTPRAIIDPRSRSSNTLKVEKTRRLSIEKDLRARAVRADSLAEGQDAPKTENLRQRWLKDDWAKSQSETWAQYLVSL